LKLKHAISVTLILFIFLVLHEADRFLISPLTPQIMKEFRISHTEMGAVFTLTIVVSALLFPIWGYLFDKFSRRFLITIAGLIWGFTTWLNALAQNFIQLMITRSLTGVDDASTVGIYSLISDYFRPEKRGKVIGLLNSSSALGAILGTLLGLSIGIQMGWRYTFYITGSVGIIVALAVYFIVKDVPRGSSDPGLEDVLREDIFRFNIETAKKLLKKKSMILLCLQGFFGVFPWQVLTFWMIKYLIDERNFTTDQAMTVMVLLLVFLSIGYILGGVIGDFVFRKTIRGRAIIVSIVVFASALMIYITFSIPYKDVLGFTLMSSITAIVIPMAAANVGALVFDITEPEVRSTARSILRVLENSGSALAPLVAGILADMYSLHFAILWISVSTWLLCGIFSLFLVVVVRSDIKRLYELLRERGRKIKSGGVY